MFITVKNYKQPIVSSISEVAQSCPTETPWTIALQGSSVHGIFQARVLEWVAISFSKGSSQSRDQTQISCTATGALPSEPPVQIKATERYHLQLVRMTIIKKSTNNKCWRGSGENRTFLHCLQVCKYDTATTEDGMEIPLETRNKTNI